MAAFVIFNGDIINMSLVEAVEWHPLTNEPHKHKVTITFASKRALTWTYSTKQAALDAIEKLFADARVYMINETP